MRRTITVGLVVIGLALMLIGYLLAAPWGSHSVADSDPTMTGAPAVFLLGIVSVVGAAVIYELLPERRK